MKRMITLLLAACMLLSLAACGSKAEKEEPSAGMPNPWREITAEEAEALCPGRLAVPVGAENVTWRALETAGNESGIPGTLVQLDFDLDGLSFTAREQLTGDPDADISGMYYQWTAQTEDKLSFWGDMPCRSFRFIGEEGYADLCSWYDYSTYVSYTLSVTAEDLDGFDLLAVAEALHP